VQNAHIIWYRKFTETTNGTKESENN